MKISRRVFLGSSAAAGGGLILGFGLRHPFRMAQVYAASENPFDAWVQIHPDNSSQIVLAQSEMGQGVYTALPMIVAEEADLDWSRVQVIPSELSRDTGGSGSVTNNYMLLRRVGASVRALMIAAAATSWNVPEAECTAANSEVFHAASGKKATYGALAEAARGLPLPDAARLNLKHTQQYKLIGRTTPHLDILDKCTGKTRFGLDVRLPGMVYAVISRCPVFGGTASSFDASKALATPGVLQVFEIPARGYRVFTAGGIVVVATSTWAAIQGRRALTIQWNPGRHVDESSQRLRQQMQQSLAGPPAWCSELKGPDPDTVPAATRIETVYEFLSWPMRAWSQ